MRKIIIIVITLVIFGLIYDIKEEDMVVIPSSSIRLRVIPNSNSILDQKMKGKVKDYLEDNIYNLVKNEEDIDSARNNLKEKIPQIEESVNRIFEENNYVMDYNVNYGNNYFPEKKYHGITYKEGYYESLVVSIGKAEGDNWWCILFPNYCLLDLDKKEEKEYKIWIVETINKIF